MNKKALVQEYRKNRARIQRFIKRAEARGYLLPEDLLPPIPKRITKASVDRLKKLTPKKIYEKSEYVGEATFGEIVSAAKGRQLETKKSQAKRKATNARIAERERRQKERETVPTGEPVSISDIIISNWRESLTMAPNSELKQLLNSWLDSMIRENGKENVAKMLEDGAAAGIHITFEVLYKPEACSSYIADIMQYLPDQGVLYQDQVLDKVNFSMTLNDLLERAAVWDE